MLRSPPTAPEVASVKALKSILSTKNWNDQLNLTPFFSAFLHNSYKNSNKCVLLQPEFVTDRSHVAKLGCTTAPPTCCTWHTTILSTSCSKPFVLKVISHSWKPLSQRSALFCISYKSTTFKVNSFYFWSSVTFEVHHIFKSHVQLFRYQKITKYLKKKNAHFCYTRPLNLWSSSGSFPKHSDQIIVMIYKSKKNPTPIYSALS